MDMGLSGHEHEIYKNGIKGCWEFSEVTQAGGERGEKVVKC